MIHIALNINGFDYFGLPDINSQSFVLCNPDKTPLYSISGISERKLEWNLNALSTLTFKIHPVVNGRKMDYYDAVKSKRLILVDGLAYFQITSVIEKNNGTLKYKEITANTLESELIFKHVNIVSGTYKFYDVLAPEDTLLHKVLSSVPDWSVGHVDIDLMNKWRYFEISTSDLNIYNFLMTDVSETIECIFKFDTFNKTVSAYSVENIIKPTDIFLSHDNLILETEINNLTDELYTCLNVSGGNDLSIYTVNPLGNSKIYNFSYYKTTEWMEQTLIDAIDAWESKVESQSVIHKGLIQDYYDMQASLYGAADNVLDSGLYGLLDRLKQELDDLEIQRSGKIARNENLSSINIDIENKQNEILLLESEISDILNDISIVVNELGIINADLALDNNFSEELLKKLSPFIIEGDYQNENFLQLDTMKISEIQDQAQQLYDQSIKVLDRISQPRYEFKIDSLNLLFMKEFEHFSNQLELGCEVYAELDEGVIYRPILLQVQLNYDDPSDFSMVFGNRLRLDSSDFIYTDLFSKAVSAGNSVSLNSVKWNSFQTNYKDEITDFMTSALDASKNKIISSENQEFVLGSFGLRGRTLTPEGYSHNQIWLTNSTLAFTDDNWETSKLALGEIELDSGLTGYGLIADFMVGKLVASNQLLISNEAGSVIIDSSGMTVNDMDFMVKHTEEGVTTEHNLNEFVLEPLQSIYTTIGDAFKSPGILDAGKLDGIIDATHAQMSASNSQVLFDSTGMWLMNNSIKNNATEAIWMNEDGILLGKRSVTGEWLPSQFTTAVTPSGISADIITTGTLNAINIKGGSIYIGGDGTPEDCNFGITPSGMLVGMKTANGLFSVDENGNVVIEGGLVLGGSVTWNVHDPTIATAQDRADSAYSRAGNALSTANEAIDDVLRLANGMYTDSDQTFIYRDIIYSPNIQAGKFYGAGSNSAYAVVGIASGNFGDFELVRGNSGSTSFQIYDNGTVIDFYAIGRSPSSSRRFLSSSGSYTYPYNVWDFSNASVIGITATFA